MKAEDYDCIVLVGGNGTRLNSCGPKALLSVGQRRAIDWTLNEICDIQFKGVFIVGPSPSINRELKQEARQRLVAPVHTFRDSGMGVHGIPYQMRSVLSARRFLILAGHAMLSRCDVVRMLNCRAMLGVGLYQGAHEMSSRTVVPRNSSGLPPKHIRMFSLTRAEVGSDWFVALPYSFDRRYMVLAKKSHFSIDEILQRVDRDDLELVELHSPVEADVASEWTHSVNITRSRPLGRACIRFDRSLDS